jgi:hypothetical protein
MQAAAKTPVISASATNETTTGMRVEWAETGWLTGASGLKQVEKNRLAPHVVDGASDGTCAGTGKVGGIRMHPPDHIGSPIDFAGVGMGGDISDQTIETRHGGEGGGCLFTGESAGGGEDAIVHAAPVVKQVADSCL